MLREPPNNLRWQTLGTLLLAAAIVSGCTSKPKTALGPRFQELGKREVPPFLQGTILEVTDLEETAPFVVSAYSLVVNLRGTGDSFAPTAVRDHMLDELAKHQFGQSPILGYRSMRPEDVLRDPRVAIVRVDGFIPPGVREGEHFDLQVSALPESHTTSLAHGQLYETDLDVNSADPASPKNAIHVYARAGSGQVFVNPAYALGDNTAEGAARAKASLRYGVMLGGGMAMVDRALILRLRTPQYSQARAIEGRINTRFQAITDKKRSNDQWGMAEAKNEGLIYFYVPRDFPGGWEHFAAVVRHLYLNGSPQARATKAQELAQLAVTPDAPLQDISYCWEGLGPEALPVIQPLYTHPAPEVAFAAAKAGAYLHDPSARLALLTIAQTSKHPFQLNAVQVLGSLPRTPAIAAMMRKLLQSPETLVRLEAYRALVASGDPMIFSRVVEEKFVLDVVSCDAPPLIYATRTGMPRLAIIGNDVKINSPLTFTAMQQQFMISAEDQKDLSVFYRGPQASSPLKLQVAPKLAMLAAILGGETGIDPQTGRKEPFLDFSYGEVVAIVSALAGKQVLLADCRGQAAPATFVLQDLPSQVPAVYSAPAVADSTASPGELPDLDTSVPASRMNAGGGVGGVGGSAGRPQ